jgi:hypothetical protein
VSDLLDLEVAVIAKDDSNPLIRVEMLEGPLEGVTIGELSGGVMRVSVLSCPIQRVVASISAAAKAVAAGVGEDAPEPCLEAVEVAELRKLAPGSGERIVGRIFGLLGVAKDEAGQPIGLVEARVDQGLEGGDARRIRRCRDGSGILRQPGPRFAAVRYTCTDASGGSRIQSTPRMRRPRSPASFSERREPTRPIDRCRFAAGARIVGACRQHPPPWRRRADSRRSASPYTCSWA